MTDDQFAELLSLNLHYAKRLDDSNPDVGFGPSIQTLLNKIIDKLSFSVPLGIVQDALKKYKAKY